MTVWLQSYLIAAFYVLHQQYVYYDNEYSQVGSYQSEKVLFLPGRFYLAIFI